MEGGSDEPLLSKDTLHVGGRVLSCPSEQLKPEPADIVAIESSRVYVHFVARDRRMDRWVNLDEVRQIPESMRDAFTTSSIKPYKLTRAKTRQLQEQNPVSEREVGNEAVARAEREREERTKVKNVGCIIFGLYQLDAWYYSPFPVGKGETIEYIFMCEYCLKYMYVAGNYNNHRKRCEWEHPPGLRLYNDARNKLAVYEVDGIVNVAYCQRLTLLGKLFLDHKTLFFNVAPFLFYVVTIDGEVAGFFSKERPERRSEFNLACLLILPQHQKKGIGRFLISLSYELGQREGGKARSPERPLSDLGQVSYKSFWAYEILRYAERMRGEGELEIPAERVSTDTGIREWDVVETIKRLAIFKMWRGSYSLHLSSSNKKALSELRKPRLPLKPQLLHYTTRMELVQESHRKKKSGQKRGRGESRNSDSSTPSKTNGTRRISQSNSVYQKPVRLRKTCTHTRVRDRSTSDESARARKGCTKKHQTPVKKKSFGDSTEPIPKIQCLNGSLADTPGSSSCGGKDISCVSQVMDILELKEPNQNGNEVGSQGSDSRLAKGGMVSELLKDVTHDSETPLKMDTVEDKRVENLKTNMRALQTSGVHQTQVSGGKSIKVEQVPAVLTHMKGWKMIELQEGEKPSQRISSAEMSNGNPPIEIIDLLDTDDEASPSSDSRS